MVNSPRKLKHPKLWISEKYLRWHKDHSNPRFVMPLPSGGKRSVTVTRYEAESELDLFKRCLDERDAMGRKLWGDKTWRHMVTVKTRIVTKGGRSEEETGVRHVVSLGKLPAWQATWYERDTTGKRRQKNVQFSYGGPRATCLSAEEAKEKAVALRQRKAAAWYISDPKNRYKRKESYKEIFQNEIGIALSKKIAILEKDQQHEKISLVLDQHSRNQLNKKQYMAIPLDDLLDIAERLGVLLELTTSQGPAYAE